MSVCTYEESVQWLRSQAEYEELVKFCHLDENNLFAAERFLASEEFDAIRKFLNLTRESKKLKILDLGCGNGIASYAFASLGHEVCAVDPDLSSDVGLGAIEQLNHKLQNGSILTAQAFAESLPYPDGTFDIVYERQALHHFSDLLQGLSECSRVLKPNGEFLATREHVVNDEEQLKEFLENHILHQRHGGENAYSLDEYISALKQAGFKYVKTIAPFDNVVNHFPASNADIKSSLSKALRSKIGNLPASILANFPMLESLYRSRLSNGCNSPGRLFSFMCHK